MRLYIWEGNGISSAYHDGGTLVVLAESPEEARAVVRREKAEHGEREKAWLAERDAFIERFAPDRRAVGLIKNAAGVIWFHDPEGAEIWARYPTSYGVWDGSDEALDRPPDRTVELHAPCVVAFNGRGYD